MTENITNEEILVLEASKSAVIDTACTKTVAAEQWFVNYKSNLTDDSIKNIKIFQSDTKVKFGDGKQVSAFKRVIFPAKIAGKICQIEAKASKSKFNQITKIHAQFGHASKDSMEKILKDANLLNNDIKSLVKKVIDSCKTCIKFRKPKLRPIVAFSKADDFNKTVSLDLRELKPGLWYFHMIDEFSRFSAAAIITNKSHCAKVFLRYWTAVFGAPNKVFSDKDGEFVREAFHEMCERFNIKIQTTPAY